MCLCCYVSKDYANQAGLLAWMSLPTVAFPFYLNSGLYTAALSLQRRLRAGFSPASLLSRLLSEQTPATEKYNIIAQKIQEENNLEEI